jgi:hypothetical protein
MLSSSFICWNIKKLAMKSQVQAISKSKDLRTHLDIKIMLYAAISWNFFFRLDYISLMGLVIFCCLLSKFMYINMHCAYPAVGHYNSY